MGTVGTVAILFGLALFGFSWAFDRSMRGLLRLLRLPVQRIGKDLPEPLAERFYLCAFRRLRRWPFVYLRIWFPIHDNALPPEIRCCHKLVFHRLLRPDLRDKGAHSHPWPFQSVVIAGSYTEQVVASTWLHFPNQGDLFETPAFGQIRVISRNASSVWWERVQDGEQCRTDRKRWYDLALSGEILPVRNLEVFERQRGEGSYAAHPAHYLHTVVDGSFPCWTLALLGPHVLGWGFPQDPARKP